MAGIRASETIPQLAAEQNVPHVSIGSVLKAGMQKLPQLLQTVKAVSVVMKLLQYRRQNVLSIGVASGGEREDVLTSLRYLDINVSHFGAVVTAEKVHQGKPHPETLHNAAEKHGLKPSDCIGLKMLIKVCKHCTAHAWKLPHCIRAPQHLSATGWHTPW
ncbi:Fructose-1-phosphate phosphatase YqaB [Gracilaria domingensis]|nr:Fructose-1-phosphate phosphatase YqaB [Gracilaria domingensis]